MATAMHPDGFFWSQSETPEGNLGWQLYLPVSLRNRNPLILRQVLGKWTAAAPPAPVGDVILQTGIYAFDEIANTLVLEGAIGQTFSFIDAVNVDEWVYQDIDISGYCHAGTSHLWILVKRAGAEELDTLDAPVYYANGRTLIEEDEP